MKIKAHRNSMLKLICSVSILFSAIASFWFPLVKDDLLSILLIITNLFSIWIGRKNQISLFISFVMLYFNFSITLSTYTLHINSLEWNTLLTYGEGYYYSQAIWLLLLFNILFMICIITEEYVFKPIKIGNGNFILFLLFYIILLFVLLFGVNREVSSLVYEVRITPIFEYSIILFLICYIFSNQSSIIQKYLIIFLAFLFILQDAIYGGRITSIQLLIFIGFSYFSRWINLRSLSIFFTLAILFFTFIGRLRGGDSLSLYSLFEGIVNDTSNFAYAASTTHLFTIDQINYSLRFKSFIYFILSFFVPLSQENALLSNVTAYSNNFKTNVGGGIIFSHMYFWGGYPLLTIFPIIFNFLIRVKERSFKNFDKGILLLLVSYFPRMYLYTPKIGLRAAFIIFPIIWLVVGRLKIVKY